MRKSQPLVKYELDVAADFCKASVYHSMVNAKNAVVSISDRDENAIVEFMHSKELNLMPKYKKKLKRE